MSDKIVTL